MKPEHEAILRSKMDRASLANLEALAHDGLNAFVADAIELCRPDSVKVCTDDRADADFVRQCSIETGEELPLTLPGHSVHFDGYRSETRHDMGRDKEVTRYLVPEGMSLGRTLNQIPRDQGLSEMRALLAGSMVGKRMFVLFFCLGPTGSAFGIPCVQVTDSSYVAHSEAMLYRPGFREFQRLSGAGGFFRFLHSAGRLVNNISADTDRKRIYIDLAANTVFSVNTQYAGNTVGLKKLALRLAICKADREKWLAEHMFVMGVHGPRSRVTYFTGAFPSACGKTSTAMIPGETIVGDDLAYLRAVAGEVRAVNVEAGIFGIIQDVNAEGDPAIWKVLASPGEAIFSNVLVKDGAPYWMGMGREIPADGLNHSGQWFRGKTDLNGVLIGPSHKNARYTVRLASLQNLDERADDPAGVAVGGVIYGGRDSDTTVPVQEAFDVTHGILAMGASLESETTAATLGKEGIREFNLMSNLDFLAIPVGKYLRNHLDFFGSLKNPPAIFMVNYFLKGSDGKYLNTMRDKAVWIKWMELRAHDGVETLPAPTGLIPIYQDLAKLFHETLGKDYTREAYVSQFSIRVLENLSKLDRIENIYRSIEDIPDVLFDVLSAQRDRLLSLQSAQGNLVSPLDLA